MPGYPTPTICFRHDSTSKNMNGKSSLDGDLKLRTGWQCAERRQGYLLGRDAQPRLCPLPVPGPDSANIGLGVRKLPSAGPLVAGAAQRRLIALPHHRPAYLLSVSSSVDLGTLKLRQNEALLTPPSRAAMICSICLASRAGSPAPSLDTRQSNRLGPWLSLAFFKLPQQDISTRQQTLSQMRCYGSNLLCCICNH